MAQRREPLPGRLTAERDDAPNLDARINTHDNESMAKRAASRVSGMA
jgi:hypothetical protein